MKASGFSKLLDLLIIIVSIVILLLVFYPVLQLRNVFGNIFGGNNIGIFPTVPTTTIPPQNYIIQYALTLVNKDRNQYGLANVTLVNTTSGRQHADSMLM